MEQLLSIRNLKTHFFMHDHVVKAVDGVDLYLDKGETLGLVGESGCGKSVMSMSIMRLVPNPPGRVVSGSIELEKTDLLSLSESEMRRVRGNRISMIFQEPMTSLNPVMTIGKQISEPLMLHKGMTKADGIKESIRLLELVGIPEAAERVKEYPFQLSGGLRQRVMIAMALSCDPSLLIADEPTTALDVTIQAQILRLMRELKAKTASSIIFITHDLAVIAGFADRVTVMYAGVVMESSPVKDLFAEPLHPYTQGLMGSIPKLGSHKMDATGTRTRLRIIPGSLPDPRNFPKGCRFSPRCEHVMPRCLEMEPALVDCGHKRKVRCFLHADTVQGE
jgi:oligopeptide/dipeptide ABC transporter ATP-binding protein